MYPYLSVDDTYDHRVVRTTIDTFTTLLDGTITYVGTD